MTVIKRGVIAILALFFAQFAAQAEVLQPTIYMVTIHTANFPEMKTFFKDKMKMELVSDSGEFVEFQSNGLRLSLASHKTLSSFLDSNSLNGKRTGSGLGIGFKYENPEQVDIAYKALLKNGVKGVAEPAQQPWGEYTAFFADPDGNVHELVADTK
ncbi:MULTISPECIES: VOC family protein [unclassified Pseudovibrio]|uniref:VOC family protein n=1 Tax=unclassified Pseudovibrio TaxID=2627060 RepID=UPI0007AE8331|nr:MULTISPECIES: VOC family protein [unclassified Pseudovibrio]KZL13561.1 Glyoxalase-like domain protein [Pseudovibrio sp. Ad37]KZL23235.1 Glyoxalase-like domain protein [Pseudovibrio sp. WM33]